MKTKRKIMAITLTAAMLVELLPVDGFKNMTVFADEEISSGTCYEISDLGDILDHAKYVEPEAQDKYGAYSPMYSIESGYYKLMDDIDIDGALQIGEGKEVVLDLNGHTLNRGLTAETAMYHGCVIGVYKAKLTIDDTSADKDGAITGGAGMTYGDYGCGYENGCYGGGVGVFMGELILNNGTIRDNYSKLCGGGVMVYGSEFTMNGGAIVGNTGGDIGGGVYVGGDGYLDSPEQHFTMNGGRIADNTAIEGSYFLGCGGGVGLLGSFDKTYFTLNDGCIQGNTAASGGGVGAYFYDGTEDGGFTIAGGEISYNTALEELIEIGGDVCNTGGGGVITHLCDATITGGKIQYNTAQAIGGGVQLYRTGANISGSPVITENVVGGTVTKTGEGYSLSGGSASNVTFGEVLLDVDWGSYLSTNPIIIDGPLSENALIGINYYHIYFKKIDHEVTKEKTLNRTLAVGENYTITDADASRFFYDLNPEAKGYVYGDNTMRVAQYMLDDENVSVSVKEYDGSSSSPVVKYNDTVLTDSDYSISYKQGDEAVDAVTPGTYTAVITGGGLYRGTVEKTFAITTKSVTVKADDFAKEYGSSDPDFTATVTGLVTGDSLDYTISRAEGENIGSYTITPSGDAAQGYYDVTYETGTLTISQKVVTPVIELEDAQFVYDGTAKEPAVIVKYGDAVIDSSLYSVSYENNTEAGTATARVTFGDQSGNNVVYENVSAQFTIGRASISPAVTIDGWVALDTAATPVVTGNTGNADVTFEYSADGETYTSTVPTEAGDYYLRANVAESENYQAGSAVTQFTILGKYTVTLPEHMEFTSDVVFVDGKIVEGTVVKFQVSEGYGADNVTVGETILTADNGVYSFTVTADTTVNAVVFKTVSYIDADGQEQICGNYAVLEGSTEEQTLPAGWYVVDSDITIPGLILEGETHIILTDGHTLTMSSGEFINTFIKCMSGDLTIYGQSEGSGILNMAHTNSFFFMSTGINCGNNHNVTFNGGNVISNGTIGAVALNIEMNGGTLDITASGYNNVGLHAYDNLTINKGTLLIREADKGIRAEKSIVINGGSVAVQQSEYGMYCDEGVITVNDGTISVAGTTCGVYAGNGIVYSHNGASTSIYVQSYDVVDGGVTIAANKVFGDEDGGTYYGNISDATILNGKTLTVKKLAYGSEYLEVGVDNGGLYYIIDSAEAWNIFVEYSQYNSTDGKRFVQTADIDLSNCPNAFIEKKCFDGTYNGNGYSISNYSISHSFVVDVDDIDIAVMGLFPITGPNSQIENVHLDNCIIHAYGKQPCDLYAGGLVGYCNGTIANCSATNSTIVGKVNNGDLYLGGLVGGGSPVWIESCLFDGTLSSEEYGDSTCYLGSVIGKMTNDSFYSFSRVYGCADANLIGYNESGLEDFSVYKAYKLKCSGCTVLDGSVVYEVDGVKYYTSDTDVYVRLTEREGYCLSGFTCSNGTLIATDDAGVYKYQPETYSTDVSIAMTLVKDNFEDGIGEKLTGCSLSLSGNIGVNFHMMLSSDLKNSATYSDDKMVFTLPDGSYQEVRVGDSEEVIIDGLSYNVFGCEIAAKYMTGEIKAQYVCADGTKGTMYTYSVKEYADYLLAHVDDNTQYAEAADLVRAMLNYGAYSQIFFDYNTDNLPNADLSDEQKNAIDSVNADVMSAFNYDSDTEDLPSGLEFVGSNLQLESETNLRLYFANETGKELTFKIGDKVLAQTTEDGYTLAIISGIPAAELTDTYCVSVVVEGDTENYEVQFSPMSYCYFIVSRSATTLQRQKLKKAMQAMYLYSVAASDYIN
ncbi:MAG: carbohydrate-binding domain-containing protein [Lachnospiraceae bacterium]|nr:carbohydrate-binding domain-containing protein [Lachnospiraceae bacterium]